MWVFDAEGQNSTHLGCDLSRMMGCLFCSVIGSLHLFVSSVLLMPLSPFLPCPSYLFCNYFPLSCFNCHTPFLLPLSLLSICLPYHPFPFFFIYHLIVSLLPLPTLPIFMLPNLCSFILLFLLTFTPFCHSSCALGTAVGFPCFSVP